MNDIFVLIECISCLTKLWCTARLVRRMRHSAIRSRENQCIVARTGRRQKLMSHTTDSCAAAELVRRTKIQIPAISHAKNIDKPMMCRSGQTSASCVRKLRRVASTASAPDSAPRTRRRRISIWSPSAAALMGVRRFPPTASPGQKRQSIARPTRPPITRI